MKKYKFLVDLDDVLRDTTKKMVEIYNKSFRTKMTYEDVTEYNVNKAFPKVVKKFGDARKWFFETHAYEVFMESDAISESVDAIKKLQEYGTVHIVTKQYSPEDKVFAILWLDNFGVKYNSISFVETKDIIDCDFFIDDFQDNFIGCGREGAVGVLLNAPYNRNVGLEELRKKTKFGKFVRFDSLSEFVNNIKKFI